MKTQNFGLFVEGNQLGHKGSDSTTRPPEPTVDQWFAKARDNENDFRNLTVEDYRRNMTALAEVADARIAKLTAQRDELLAALKDCVTENGATAFVHPKYAPQRLRAINNIVSCAIAKCEANKE